MANLAAGGGRTQAYSPNVKAPAEVYVNGVRIPVFQLESHLRKDGVCAINRMTEVHFPAEWEGVDYQAIVKELDPAEESPYSSVEVKVRDYGTDELVTTHAGFVLSIGVGASGQLERRMRVADIGYFLSAIPVSKTFSLDETAQDALEFIRDKLQASQPIADDIEIVGNAGDDWLSYSENNMEDAQTFPAILTADKPTTTSFSANRDTLADVLNWFIESMGGYAYFDYNEVRDAHQLVYVEEPSETLKAQHLGGSVTVLDNTALVDISPYNTITAYGRSKESKLSIGGHSLLVPSKEFPRAVVYHKTLRKRAGGNALQPAIQDVDGITIDQVTTQAKNILRNILEDSSGGEIVCQPSPSLVPYAVFKSRMACDGSIQHDVPILSYDVEEVTHTIDSTEGHTTTLRVSMHADPDEIVVDTEQTGMLEA